MFRSLLSTFFVTRRTNGRLLTYFLECFPRTIHLYIVIVIVERLFSSDFAIAVVSAPLAATSGSGVVSRSDWAPPSQDSASGEGAERYCALILSCLMVVVSVR
ncbi:unnamed protein product [Amoebophrya sp. A25]|nr:unnamed protein product [Amoebophrya sp. A25]|eukprot:GSA25T00006077001.1